MLHFTGRAGHLKCSCWKWGIRLWYWGMDLWRATLALCCLCSIWGTILSLFFFSNGPGEHVLYVWLMNLDLTVNAGILVGPFSCAIVCIIKRWPSSSYLCMLNDFFFHCWRSRKEGEMKIIAFVSFLVE